MTALPPDCQLRRARVEDLPAIRGLVWRAALDPTQLRWQQFWLIECAGAIAACGQLRQFPGAQELGSLVVAPAQRDRGLGTALSQHLLATAQQPLYLECLGRRLARFYARLGFVPVAWSALPPPLRRKFALASLARAVGLPVAVMQWQGDRPERTPQPDSR